MPAYERLDAFKVCLELNRAVHRVLSGIASRDADLAGQVWLAAIIAPARIARGAGSLSRRRFAACLDRVLGALSELGYLLALARRAGALPEAAYRELETLRGRARFYVTKLLLTLPAPP